METKDKIETEKVVGGFFNVGVNEDLKLKAVMYHCPYCNKSFKDVYKKTGKVTCKHCGKEVDVKNLA